MPNLLRSRLLPTICFFALLCSSPDVLWGQSLDSSASVGHYSWSDECAHRSLTTTPAVCHGAWQNKNDTASGAGVSAAASNYGVLRIGASAACVSVGQPPPPCSEAAAAIADFDDEVTFDTLPNGQYYFSVTISAATFTPQGESNPGVSETAILQGDGGNDGCDFSWVPSGACSAVVPISNDSKYEHIQVFLQGYAQVTSPGLAGFQAGFGKHPYTGGKVIAAYVQDANGKPVKGVKVVSTSGYKYPSKFTTTTTLTSKPNPSKQGQSVVFTATPASQWPVPSGSVPTGKVVFKDGATVLGTARLQAGVAKFRTSALSTGTHQITATYDGDPFFAGSMSSVLNQIVN